MNSLSLTACSFLLLRGLLAGWSDGCSVACPSSWPSLYDDVFLGMGIGSFLGFEVSFSSLDFTVFVFLSFEFSLAFLVIDLSRDPRDGSCLNGAGRRSSESLLSFQ